MRARLHVSTFEFSRALTASYQITQPLTENGRVTISLLLKARPHPTGHVYALVMR